MGEKTQPVKKVKKDLEKKLEKTDARLIPAVQWCWERMAASRKKTLNI